MTGSEIIAEIHELVSRNTELEEMIEKSVPLDKFYNVALTTEIVGLLHGVSAAIVRRYIGYGLIKTHPMSTDAKLLIRGSEALSLDFDEIRRKAKFLR